MTSLILLRHGRPLDVEGCCIGHTDVALSPDGREAIERLALDWRARGVEGVGEPTAIYSSDLLRARESASVLSRRWDLSVRHDTRLREMSFGAWDGKRWDDILSAESDRFREWSDNWHTMAPPDGEALTHLEQRTRSWLIEVVGGPSHASDCIVVVTHAGWIRVALCILLQRPLTRMFDFSPDYGSITVLSVTAGTVAVAS